MDGGCGLCLSLVLVFLSCLFLALSCVSVWEVEGNGRRRFIRRKKRGREGETVVERVKRAKRREEE